MKTIEVDDEVIKALQFLGYPSDTAAEILAGLPESKPRAKVPIV